MAIMTLMNKKREKYPATCQKAYLFQEKNYTIYGKKGL
jgi:hypothetical protein